MSAPNLPANAVTAREGRWRRWTGDDWAAFDALPPAIRQRIQEHAYDVWSVNAMIAWRAFRRQTGSSMRAERRLMRWLDECEALERRAFAQDYRRRHRLPLPHDAARATVLRAA
ncbi:DUF6525 family protein [Roseococcus sp. YIM B11640]|uniref:DUF6525 family protein n=1 Tax=Roseococcus sp. YIM B11640 TaxID=3133973 RepID=UPI003C7CF4F9